MPPQQPHTVAPAPGNRDALIQTWETPTGLRDWLGAVNNQVLGKRYMITAFSFFLLAGFLALVMRTQLAVPENTFLGPEAYNRLFTMHGSTMMYLFVIPFLEGLATYLIPLLIGSRDLAYPRLTALGYWTYLFGGLIFYASFAVNAVPDNGWFAYPPLAGPEFAGLGQSFWLLGLSLTELAGILFGVELIVTLLKLRAPGMSLNRMPIFAWAILVTAVMIVFAFTTLLVGTLLLELDFAAGTQFFDPQRGGSPLLWQHLFWFFGHPEVYIMFIPATGIVSMIVPVFAQRPIASYLLVVLAIVVTGFVSFGLWVHHMFTTGLPALSSSFFTAASFMIALATGTQFFTWIATLWGRRPPWKTPLLFVAGFIVIFMLGGVTGVMVAVIPFDWQVHDTYFVVAHFHYVLIGGVVFPIFAGLYYWLPKITGRMLDERLGRWNFWLTFIGFNVAFLPMHLAGLQGMPRRVYTYAEELGLGGYNLLSTVGAFILATGFLLFVVNVYRSVVRQRGAEAPADPWGGDTLEWSVASPTPIYSFEAPPIVHDRAPLWQQTALTEGREADRRVQQALQARPETWRATLVTHAVNADAEAIHYLPGPTYWPFVTAFSLLVSTIGMLAQLYWLALLGGLATAAALTAWLWPSGRRRAQLKASGLGGTTHLPLFPAGSASPGWWGAAIGGATLLYIFALLFFCYFYLRIYSPTWPQDNLPLPAWIVPGLGAVLLAVSVVPLRRAVRRYAGGATRGMTAGLATALGLGTLFVALQLFALLRLAFGPAANAYASSFYTISIYTLAVVGVGLALFVAALARIRQGTARTESFLPVQIQVAALFWYFAVAGSLGAFFTLYVSPYIS